MRLTDLQATKSKTTLQPLVGFRAVPAYGLETGAPIPFAFEILAYDILNI